MNELEWLHVAAECLGWISLSAVVGFALGAMLCFGNDKEAVFVAGIITAIGGTLGILFASGIIG